MKYSIDIDGTLMNASQAIPGALDFIRLLNRQKIEFVVMTNSIKDPKSQEKRLHDVGFHIAADSILNPIVAINRHLENNTFKKAWVIGAPDTCKQIFIDQTGKDFDIIIILDFERSNVGYQELQGIFDARVAGVPVLTASKSFFIVLAITKDNFSVTGFFLQAEPQQVTVIGDDWETDILGAMDWGVNPILVKTGKYVLGDERKVPLCRVVDTLLDVNLGALALPAQ